jgi:hypothetical protein
LFDVSNVINNVELAGSGLVGKPVTTVLSTGELSVISPELSDTITVAVIRLTLVIAWLAIDTYSMIGVTDGAKSIAIEALSEVNVTPSPLGFMFGVAGVCSPLISGIDKYWGWFIPSSNLHGYVWPVLPVAWPVDDGAVIVVDVNDDKPVGVVSSGPAISIVSLSFLVAVVLE